MSDKDNLPIGSEFKVKGQLVKKKGVDISEKSMIDALSQRGYGFVDNKNFLLSFYEALFLMDKLILEVFDKNGKSASFQNVLKAYEDVDENAWGNYLVYRDLRSRGYVVREGFGVSIDFRIYERGTYGKDSAQSLVLNVQEGKPVPMEELSNTLMQCQSLKKNLILAVMNRRGEVVYYSVSPLTFK